MNKRLFSIIYCCLFSYVPSQAQTNIAEEVYLHLNSTTLISGESLLFSAYVNSQKTNKHSPLSKILYIELINSEGQVAHRSKIKIHEGRGYGDLFISTIFPTGFYHLKAYTRWMRNFERYFEAGIIIVNPFEKYSPQKDTLQKDWSTTFFTSNDGLVQGLENNVNFRVTSTGDKELIFKGKILDDAGEVINEFAPIRNGIGSFTFTPEKITKYKVVLEDDDGKFHFFDLPDIRPEGCHVNVKESSSQFTIDVTCKNGNVKRRLLIATKNGILSEWSIPDDLPIVLRKSELDYGIYEEYLINGSDDTLSTKSFYYSDPQIISEHDNITTVSRKLNSSKIDLPNGSYSVSIKKKRSWFKDFRPTAIRYTTLLAGINAYFNLPIDVNNVQKDDSRYLSSILSMVDIYILKSNAITFLPDYRGELIQGKIIDADGNTSQNKVVYANLGTEQLAVTQSNDNGEFLINIFSINNDNLAYISVLGKNQYKINLEDNFINNHKGFIEPVLNIDSTILLEIKQSSLNAQIENAYYDMKKDSTFEIISQIPSIGAYNYVYHLDDYNRFPSLRETLVEYILPVAVKKTKGQTRLKVRINDDRLEFDESPLVILDGLPVETEDLLSFSPYRIESISIINKRVYFGSLIFDGIISFQTFDRNLQEFQVNENMSKFLMKSLQPGKIYYQPNYSDEKMARIPDKREQLYWNPFVTVDDGILDLNYYTSDIEGNYEIVIEGFSENGTPVSQVHFLKVLNNN